MEQTIENTRISKTNQGLAFHESDILSRIHLGNLTTKILNAAIHSSITHGYGDVQLKKQNLFWVTSRLSISIINPMKTNEAVSIETWQKTTDRLFHIQDFKIRDSNNKAIINASCSLLALDIISKRPKKIKGFKEGYFEELKDIYAMEDLPRSLKKIDSGDIFETEIKYSDLDSNQHVTSSKYMDWIMNTFSIDFHKTNYPQHIEINFLKEAVIGDNMIIIRKKEGKNTYLFEGVNKDNNKSIYRASIQFMN